MVVGRCLLSSLLLLVVFAVGFYAGSEDQPGPKVSVAPARSVAPRTEPASREDGPGDPKAHTLSEEELTRTAGKKTQGLVRPIRCKALPPAGVVATLGVEPGMSIVDVGAGSGYFTLALLAALGGKGHVFATEVDPRMLEYIERQAAELGYANFTAVKVRREGVDPFYRRHVFDVIFMSSVLEYLPEPVAFCRELRASLRPGTGRLVIIQGLPDEGFHDRQFGAAFQHEKFLAEGEEFPGYRRLTARLQRALRGLAPGASLGPAMRWQMASAFRAMLGDPRFFWEVKEHHERGSALPFIGSPHFKPDEIRLVQWLVYHLGELGTFDHRGRRLDPVRRAGVAALGNILLRPYFDPELVGGDFYFSRALYLSNASVVQRMAEAGYELERDVDRFEGHAFLVFHPAPDPRAGGASAPAQDGPGAVTEAEVPSKLHTPDGPL